MINLSNFTFLNTIISLITLKNNYSLSRSIIVFLFINSIFLIQSYGITNDSLNICYEIKSIKIIGNKKTRNNIILRETDFVIGTKIKIKSLDSCLRQNENRIFNTRLFNKVTVSLDTASAEIQILLEERWYIFPLPQLEFGDRNFNEWYKQRGADFRRLNLGLELIWRNVTGRNDNLNITFTEGFTQKYILKYQLPFLSKRQKEGFGFGVSYDNNKDVAYQTGKDSLVFLRAEQLLRQRFNASVNFTYRKGFFTSHIIDLDFYANRIADTVAKLNPDYYLNGKTKQNYFGLSYTYIYDRRDIRAYALKGKFIKVDVEKCGLMPFDDIDLWILRAGHTQYWDLGKQFYFASLQKIKLSYPQIQPYSHARALGYSQDFVRGYEYFAIDGPHYFLNRNTLRRRLFSYQINFKKLMPLESFKRMPFSVYLNAYFDWGFVISDRFAEINKKYMNQIILGYGLGLDIVTFYDRVFRLECSINREGLWGVYLHFTSDVNWKD